MAFSVAHHPNSLKFNMGKGRTKKKKEGFKTVRTEGIAEVVLLHQP